MRVKISSIIGLLSLIGCVYQIYGITKSYLQFKVRHDVAYDYSTYIELPAIDIIVPIFMAVNLTKMLAAYPEKLYDTCEKLREMYEETNYTSDNPVENCEEYISLNYLERVPFILSADLSDSINVKEIRDVSVDLRQQLLKIFVSSFGFLTDRQCQFTRYYNGVAIFMRIFCLNGTRPFFVNSNFVLANEGIVSYFTHSFGIHFGIRLSDPADLPDYDPSKYFMISRKSRSFPVVTISFVKTVMSSLEYPYETICRHYNKGKSISKCMTEYSLGQSTPYLYKGSMYKWSENPDHLGFNPRTGDQRDEDKQISQDKEVTAFVDCNQQAAATECKKTVYLVEGKISDEAKREYGLIVIEPSWRVNIYLSVHPVLPWSEYVIFIGSIIGFWFGISMYDLVFKIFTSIKTKFLRFKCKRK